MDAFIPTEVTGAVIKAERDELRQRSRFRVRMGRAEHTVMELTASGFVIEAEGRPPLRGYTDIFRGDERVLHGLVVCAWERDGMVGYEFKREVGGREVPADYVLPDHAGLLEIRTD